MPCGICHCPGHNRKTCPNAPQPVRVEFIGAPHRIISDSTLKACLSQSLLSDNPPKTFRQILYASADYLAFSRSAPRQRGSCYDVLRRGANAKNWRTNGEYKCPSLHMADNLYQMLGKRVWCQKMKANGTEFADSWINNPEIQCSSATQYPDQHQCKRSAYDGACHCTQHRRFI